MTRANGILLVVAIAVLLVPISVARAADAEFEAVARHFESTYNVRRNEPKASWFANVAMRLVQPKGVKTLRIATFENLKGPATDPHLGEVVRNSLDKTWKAVVRETSRVDRDQTFVYVRQAGDSLEVLIVSVDIEEATVIKARVDPKAAGSWLEYLDS